MREFKVGILGAGQLGRMLALSSYPLGMTFKCYDQSPTSSTQQVCEHVFAPFDDQAALQKFAESVDVLTYEFENVPVATAQYCAQFTDLHPSPLALETAQDRLNEKSLATKLNIPTAQFCTINTKEELSAALDSSPLPRVLKTRRMGYDGKGQFLILNKCDVNAAWQALGQSALILEEFVQFNRELSLILVRARNGDIKFYPLIENQHQDGILRRSVAPADVDQGTNILAQKYGRLVAENLKYVGVLTIEFFEMDGKLIFNEMAPRVHNSGHWTIEGAECSQFENHIRAVSGLELGSTANIGHSVMYNIIGSAPAIENLLQTGGHVHLYGKSDRPGRKLGHITFVSQTSLDLDSLSSRIARL